MTTGTIRWKHYLVELPDVWFLSFGGRGAKLALGTIQNVEDAQQKGNGKAVATPIKNVTNRSAMFSICAELAYQITLRDNF